MRGGKLIAANVVVCGDRISSCTLDGDFFAEGSLDAPRVIDSIETSLGRYALPFDADAATARVREILDEQSESPVIGATPETIVLAVQRALNTASADGDSVDAATYEEASEEHSAKTAQVPFRQVAVPAELLEEFRGRWQAMPLAVVHDKPLQPSRQMATDHAIAQAVARGDCGPMIRMWEWAASTVVIGRFQSLSHQVDLEEARRAGVGVVRRVTGGGAMFVEPANTITYSLYAPLSLVEGMSIEQSYRCCDDWILAALREIGVDARYEPINDISSSAGKIGGAAQRRYLPKDGGPGAVLHHVTMSYDIDAVKMSRILKVSREKMRYKAVQSAVRRVDPLRSQSGLGREEIIDSFISYLLRTIPGAVKASVSDGIAREAAVLDDARFSRESWTRGIA